MNVVQSFISIQP